MTVGVIQMMMMMEMIWMERARHHLLLLFHPYCAPDPSSLSCFYPSSSSPSSSPSMRVDTEHVYTEVYKASQSTPSMLHRTPHGLPVYRRRTEHRSYSMCRARSRHSNGWSLAKAVLSGYLLEHLVDHRPLSLMHAERIYRG